MNVLHITNWYPSINSPLDGIFIKEHIESLQMHNVKNKVYHLNIKKGLLNKSSFIKSSHTSIIIYLPFFKWFIAEILAAFFVFLILIKNYNKYDVLNFHVAYPNLLYWKYLKYFTNKPIICNEHWSAYGQNFGMPRNNISKRKLYKVKKIFSENILFLFVSKHLSEQVSNFTERQIKSFKILPNVVNNCFLETRKNNYKELRFLAASVWRNGKRPIEIIRGFYNFSKTHPNSELLIAGDGELMEEMADWINRLNAKNIYLLGERPKTEIAEILSDCCALCHCSEHETFSVICAESLVAGRPVIVNELPSVMEFANKDNCIIVPSIDASSWERAFEEYCLVNSSFNRFQISKDAEKQFSKWSVGEKYLKYLDSVCEKNH